uniref:Synembryn-A n=1 Tax=Clastoptera arizonana TaxID=38151 RepID=A0A1B6CFL8_9HEMI
MVINIDNITLLRLENGSLEDVKNILNHFIDQHSKTFSFSELNTDDRRKKFWTLLFSHLDKPSSAFCHRHCLACVRMLSRDKTDIEDLCCEKWMNILLYHAGLVPQEQAMLMSSVPMDNYDVVQEALKCLCNLVYNCVRAQKLCSNNHTIEAIMTRLRTYGDPHIPDEIKFFDMKMLFLLTALCPHVRPRLTVELHGITYLMEILDLILKDASGEDSTERRSHVSQTISLTVQQVNLASEVLKVLFNLTVKTTMSTGEDEEDTHFLRLESILHDLLLCEVEPASNKEALHNHVVNLLTTMPSSCHQELLTTFTVDIPKELDFEGHNMEAMAVLLQFLDDRLSQTQNTQSLQERLSPILSVLLECANGHRVLRKYLKWRILPPLKDVHRRPEEGETLRNKLCRLLTTPVNNVRDLVAELLFVLCKESVQRMIKYTGYGNAAGLFANRKILSRNHTPVHENYSSDSDSETEEYSQYKAQINPVVGCYEPPRPDPLANMTEEQKEYEAMQLVNMMDKLHRQGIVQPCRIGEDGRPEPVEHILQLQDSPLPPQAMAQNKNGKN